MSVGYNIAFSRGKMEVFYSFTLIHFHFHPWAISIITYWMLHLEKHSNWELGISYSTTGATCPFKSNSRVKNADFVVETSRESQFLTYLTEHINTLLWNVICMFCLSDSCKRIKKGSDNMEQSNDQCWHTCPISLPLLITAAWALLFTPPSCSAFRTPLPATDSCDSASFRLCSPASPNKQIGVKQ